mmetsp:Transcript_15524/g.21193  ORF Transcript_15524/g.21193 Transcript_15524/m.21193 type:complete len:144 (-) Transcript_15524:598-1029(-)|eukprot:CAMPEP_0185725618 /NCGR_PEP_ID=MMETSP1171-20130828/1828_1 /TAXON_ID=374046 /ORGANISM="Helicotheca tamensis, Strain CCMP826" /LENGTH=143 /DNA_ID=CAMNT_0028393787 /DNA_START=108 /DNA_END=539 /DNA_ORIENTATION=-
MDANDERRSEEIHGELIRFLTQSEEMRKTARGSLKQSLYAGGGAFAGSMLLGPVGGLAGGVAGSVVGYLKSDDYDGAILEVVKLEGERRERLMKDVGKVMMNAGATAQQLQSAGAFRDALTQFAQQDAVRDGVWKACMHAVNE